MMVEGLKGVSCLVLGGGGFIGRALIAGLQREGAQVSGFGRPGLFRDTLADVPWINGDFLDRVALARAVEGSEIVFHLLGGSTPESSNADPLSDLTAGAGGTLTLLEICRAEGVRKVVFASSGGTVYGIPETVPIIETAPTNPISAYGVSKLAVEKYLYLYRFLHDIDHVILRISNPFGPFQSPWRRQGLIASTVFKLISNAEVEVWGDGSVMRDYIFVDDLVDMILRAAVYGGPVKIFNAGSGVGMTVNDVISGVASVLGIEDVRKVYKPARPADVPINVLDIGRARSELNWQPRTSWEDAIQATAAWMRAYPPVAAHLEKIAYD